MKMPQNQADPRLPRVLQGEKFRYSSEEWRAIPATGQHGDELRRELEEVGNRYLHHCALENKKRSSAKDKADAERRLAESAAAFRQALNGEDSWREVLGITDIYPYLDEQLAQERSAGLFKIIAIIEDVFGKDRSCDFYEEPDPREKRDRRVLIEGLIQIWHTYTGRALPGRRLTVSDDETTELITFIAAAAKPVLVKGQHFGDGKPGRDNIRKVIDAIRKDGFLRWNHDLWKRFDKPLAEKAEK
jgi:hypothetical protein